MILNKKALPLCLFLLAFIFAGNAYAIPFTGDAWIAQHYAYGEATDEYYLIVKEPNITNVKVHGFSFKADGVERDFYELTGQAGNEGISWLQVNKINSVFGGQLAGKTFKLFFKSAGGTWYQGKIGFATFENPIDEPTNDDGQGATPVPEPTTFILLGASLVGLASLRKRFK